MTQKFSFLKSVFVLILLAFQFGYSQDSAPITGVDADALELNKTIEREISGEQKQSYKITLSANQYMLVTIVQRGIDVAARLSGADGKLLVSFDAEARTNGTEKVEFVAKTEGVYRLDVVPVYKLLPAGKYEIRLTELSAATEADQSLLEARTLFAESVRLFGAGKYAEAKEAIERAIENRQRTVGAENPTTANAMTHLARILAAQGKYDEAIQINQRVLQIREKILGLEHPDTAQSLHFLASNYFNKEDYQNSISYYQRALAIREKAFGRMHPVVAVNLLNMGNIYSDLGDKSKASELYQQSMTIFEQTVGTENFNVAVILNNLGKLYADLGEYKKAEPFSMRSVALFEKLFSPEHPNVLRPLSTLAFIYEGFGDLDKAESVYLRILKAREKNGDSEHLLNAYTLNNLGGLYARKGEFEKSETFYRRALAIGEKALGPDNPSIVGTILSGLSLLLAQKGDVAQAIKIQERANAVDERNISLNLAIGSERQKIAYVKTVADRMNQNLFLQSRFAPENPAAVELAAETVLRQKGRVMDAVSNNLIELRRRFNAQDQALLDKLNLVTTELAEVILSGLSGTTLAGRQAKIKALTDERENLEDEISRRAAGFYAKSDAVTLSAVRNLVPPSSALIEFAVYTPAESDLAVNIRKASSKPRYIAYIIPAQGEIKWKDIGATDEINSLIDEFRKTLRDPKNKDVQKFARAVDEKVMQPIRAFLGDTTHLLISPDGELNVIPFEALVDEKRRYLIENYSFSYLTSGRDLLRMRTARASKSKSLIIANPAFGAQEIAINSAVKQNRRVNRRRSVTATRNLSDTYFAPLAATIGEARSIQILFPDAAFLTGAQATETALKQTTAPLILHIATHGFFLQDAGNSSENNGQTTRNNSAQSQIENPLLRSGLALAGANRRAQNSGDDGILTALEASGLNLWGTKLVVLSACDTGLGEIKNGEGVYGLRRAFVLAGSETLLMSLWSVSDYATRELMTNYYKNLKQGMGRGAALRQVQLEMLKRRERQHPFYWAAFIQSGEWANLDGKR